MNFITNEKQTNNKQFKKFEKYNEDNKNNEYNGSIFKLETQVHALTSSLMSIQNQQIEMNKNLTQINERFMEIQQKIATPISSLSCIPITSNTSKKLLAERMIIPFESNKYIQLRNNILDITENELKIYDNAVKKYLMDKNKEDFRSFMTIIKDIQNQIGPKPKVVYCYSVNENYSSSSTAIEYNENDCNKIFKDGSVKSLRLNPDGSLTLCDTDSQLKEINISQILQQAIGFIDFKFEKIENKKKRFCDNLFSPCKKKQKTLKNCCNNNNNNDNNNNNNHDTNNPNDTNDDNNDNNTNNDDDDNNNKSKPNLSQKSSISNLFSKHSVQKTLHCLCLCYEKWKSVKNEKEAENTKTPISLTWAVQVNCINGNVLFTTALSLTRFIHGKIISTSITNDKKKCVQLIKNLLYGIIPIETGSIKEFQTSIGITNFAKNESVECFNRNLTASNDIAPVLLSYQCSDINGHITCCMKKEKCPKCILEGVHKFFICEHNNLVCCIYVNEKGSYYCCDEVLRFCYEYDYRQMPNYSKIGTITWKTTNQSGYFSKCYNPNIMVLNIYKREIDSKTKYPIELGNKLIIKLGKNNGYILSVVQPNNLQKNDR